jgi:hypothetical protein
MKDKTVEKNRKNVPYLAGGGFPVLKAVNGWDGNLFC